MTSTTTAVTKAARKSHHLDPQMIPTIAAVIIFILMLVMGRACSALTPVWGSSPHCLSTTPI